MDHGWAFAWKMGKCGVRRRFPYKIIHALSAPPRRLGVQLCHRSRKGADTATIGAYAGTSSVMPFFATPLESSQQPGENGRGKLQRPRAKSRSLCVEVPPHGAFFAPGALLHRLVISASSTIGLAVYTRLDLLARFCISQHTEAGLTGAHPSTRYSPQ